MFLPQLTWLSTHIPSNLNNKTLVPSPLWGTGPFTCLKPHLTFHFAAKKVKGIRRKDGSFLDFSYCGLIHLYQVHSKYCQVEIKISFCFNLQFPNSQETVVRKEADGPPVWGIKQGNPENPQFPSPCS